MHSQLLSILSRNSSNVKYFQLFLFLFSQNRSKLSGVSEKFTSSCVVSAKHVDYVVKVLSSSCLESNCHVIKSYAAVNDVSSSNGRRLLDKAREVSNVEVLTRKPHLNIKVLGRPTEIVFVTGVRS